MEKKVRGKPKGRWKDNVKMNVKEMGGRWGMDSINLA
jgi:hypothetical protein